MKKVLLLVLFGFIFLAVFTAIYTVQVSQSFTFEEDDTNGDDNDNDMFTLLFRDNNEIPYYISNFTLESVDILHLDNQLLKHMRHKNV